MLPRDVLLLEIVNKYFIIVEFKQNQDRIYVIPKENVDYDRFIDEVRSLGLIPLIRRENDRIYINFIEERKRFLPKYLAPILFVLTFFTTTYAGYLWWGNSIFDGLLFSISLLIILGMHELGHYICARKTGNESTLPMFIPLPPHIFPLGTLGAVILMKHPPKNSSNLLMISLSGPIMSFVTSIIFLAIGVYLSEIKVATGEIISGIYLQLPLLISFMIDKLVGLENYYIEAHPILVSAWVGLFVTFINLIPIGQLDGGHIIRALLKNRYKLMYFLMFILLLILSYYWIGWLIWAIFILFLTRLENSGPLEDITDISREEKILGIITFILLIIFTFNLSPIVYI